MNLEIPDHCPDCGGDCETWQATKVEAKRLVEQIQAIATRKPPDTYQLGLNAFADAVITEAWFMQLSDRRKFAGALKSVIALFLGGMPREYAKLYDVLKDEGITELEPPTEL